MKEDEDGCGVVDIVHLTRSRIRYEISLWTQRDILFFDVVVLKQGFSV